MKLLWCFIVVALLSGNVMASDADAIVGIWATDKAEAHVEIRRADDGYYGRIIWLKEPFFPKDDNGGMAAQPKVDRENPNPALRDRPIIGLKIMEGFRYAGDGRWRDGAIYDPENGQTYKCRLSLTRDGRLKVRGYVGVSLFGRTTEWTSVLRKGTPGHESDQ